MSHFKRTGCLIYENNDEMISIHSVFRKGMYMSLIEDAKQKNPVAFEQLMQMQLKRMYRVAIMMLKNDQDAADAIQETTLKCWEKLGQLRNEDYFETWLMRILINQCKNILQEKKKCICVDELPEIVHEDKYDILEWKEILSKVNAKYGIVLELYYVDGYSTKEIAKILHITELNVRTRMKRGREQLERMVCR